jgi:CspA family cold shock protein
MDSVYKFLICLVVAGGATLAAGLLPPDPGPALLGALFLAATALTAIGVSLLPAATASTPSRSADSSGSSAPRRAPAAAQSGRENGVVKWFDAKKGYGFIVRDSGEEIFVHFRSVRGEGRRGLNDGQAVSFRVEDTEKGPQAEDVEPSD